ncbi:Spo0E family sporulation regulatory protein-aspartic acid phosphatase [Rossellomorea aquimaris]|jgi:hypothetical protein|uniref:Spo0E family sporulation regulatory protein-aspartic acid phosphatase n=1 Tax=Rossellomorea aquimaris TaxID=189382 RepID=UPI003CE85D09
MMTKMVFHYSYKRNNSWISEEQMLKECELQRRIEGMRKKLIQTASNYGLNSKRTIKISQELDSLLILIQKKR